MKIILLKDVKGKGKKDDIINVSDGYGNNYLIKNKLGILYTEGSKKVLDREIKERKEEEEKLVSNLEQIKEKLENKNIKFKVSTGTNDKVFGNISTKAIADELKKMGYNIDKKCLVIDHPLDSLGTHQVLVELHKRVKFNINIVLEK